MSKTISIRLSPSADAEFETRVQASGKGPSSFAKELLEQALQDHRQTEELKHRLETMESKLDNLQTELFSFGKAILMGIGSVGTDKKLSVDNVRAWLETKSNP